MHANLCFSFQYTVENIVFWLVSHKPLLRLKHAYKCTPGSFAALKRILIRLSTGTGNLDFAAPYPTPLTRYGFRKAPSTGAISVQAKGPTAGRSGQVLPLARQAAGAEAGDPPVLSPRAPPCPEDRPTPGGLGQKR